jgi:glycosyltransferase involved in cell wall biosynthesis/GT2 family glycosyltransferase/predicted SAM-dependent methyltransferase
MENKKWIWVKNPGGRIVEVDEVQWPVLEKKGFQLCSNLPETSPSASITSNLEKADLNFVASFWSSNGMGRVGEEVLLSLDKLGLKINVQSLYTVKEGLQPRTLELLEKQYDPSEKTLLYSIPQPLDQYHTKETYLHIPWDTSKAPDLWVELMNKYCKKIYPCSHFTREVFEKSGVTVPMETIKHGVRFDKFPVLNRKWDKNYTFLTFGDISLRKGTDILVNAFEKAFPKKFKDVKLIIKSNKTMDWGRIEIPKDKRITVIEETYDHEQLLKLMQQSNCFVLPSRAEGFGLPILEAMATGMPTIFSNSTGMTGFTNDKYNYPVASTGTMEPPKWMYPEEYFEGGGIGNWSDTSVDSLAKMMKYVYQRRLEGKKKGLLAAKWVREMWDWDTQVKKMWEDMNQTPKMNWGDFYDKDTLTKNNVQDSVNSHKELFWTILGYKPKKIIETGCGTGEMAGWLSWKDKLIEGKKLLDDTIKEVIAIDIESKVIQIAKTNLHAIDGKVKLVQADAWKYEEKADLIFSQGLLEHFSDVELKNLIDHQLTQAPVLVHSVPNNNYGKKDYGNERLMTNDEWYKIFTGYNLHIYNYWDVDDKKTQSILIFQREPKFTTSIIMPVWNHKEVTINAIEAIQKNTKDYELIVIDNDSSDGIEKWLDEHKEITTLHVSRNLGVPRAKNIGVALAQGKYIAFIDNDTVAGEKWLEPLLDTFKNTTTGFTAHEGYLVDYDNRNFLGPKSKTKNKIEWASGSVFVYPKTLTREVGELIDYDLWCVEDVDFCCKIRQAGYIGRLPDTESSIVHLGSETAKKFDFSVERFNKWANKVWTEWEPFLQANRNNEIRIDIGVGDAPAPGYLHVDIQQKYHVEVIADTKHLPFETNSLAEVRNAHLIEHFDKKELDEIFTEWIRVLKQGGLLRIICPDFRQICQKFVNGETDVERALSWTYGGQLDKYDYHYWMYTPETLCDLFKKYGLIDIKWRYNENGWLEVTGVKNILTDIRPETSPVTLSQPKIGVFITHVHTYGGGENCTFQILHILNKLYPGQVEVISSEPWQIDPKVFGVDIEGIKKVEDTGQTYDIFINISHFTLHKPMGKVNYAFVFYPQYDWKENLKNYGYNVITQSKFIQKEIKDKWGMDSLLAYPPTNIDNFKIDKKEKIIMSVGRFFHVDRGNNKNHEVMIDAFKKMPPGWRLLLIGSVQNEIYLKNLKEQAQGFNIEFLHDISFDQLVELYSKAKVYWHAAGYGTKEPASQEHFGMVAVEALASGCHTVVFNGGGIAEMDGVSVWNTTNELLLKTISNTPKPEDSRKCSKKYSVEAVTKMWEDILNAQ